MGKLDGKVAVVTGGSKGMGRGSAEVLAQEGAFVVVIGTSEDAEKVAAEIRASGGKASYYRVDVRDGARLEEIYKEVAAEHGSLDIVVNSAGIGSQRSFVGSDDAYLAHYLDVNFKGVWNSCHAAVPFMIKQGYGKIVNFASVTGIMVVDPCMTAYAATKGAIMAFTKALASELACYGITVNAILPGMIDTPMTDTSCREANPEDPESVKRAIAANIPMGRLGTAEEAGKVALFLASDDSSYVTGVGIVFDGGSTLPENPGSGWQPAEG